jgi:mxaL protein
MLDPAAARPQPTATDLRWIPALLGLLLLAWRFVPDLAVPKVWRRAVGKRAS